MSNARAEAAREIARCVRHLERVEGQLQSDGTHLWVLAAPASRSPDPEALAAALLAHELPAPIELGRLIGAREVLEINPARLASWARSLASVRGRRDLAELIKEGQRPLRRLRGADLGAMTEAWDRRLRFLADLSATEPHPALLGPWQRDAPSRLAVLLGSEAAGRAQAALAQDLARPQRQQVIEAARAWLRAARTASQGLPLHSEAQRRLVDTIQTLPEQRQARTRALVAAFSKSVGLDPPPVRARASAEIASAAADVPGAIRALRAAWLCALPPCPLTAEAQVGTLTLILASPEVPISLPLEPRQARQLVEWLPRIEPARLRAAQPLLVPLSGDAWTFLNALRLLASPAGFAEVRWVLRGEELRNMLPSIIEWAKRPRRLAAWRRLVQRLEAAGSPSELCYSEWLAGRWMDPSLHAPGVLLAIARRDDLEGGVLLALSVALGQPWPALEQGLRRWSTPAPGPATPEQLQLASALQLDVAELQLHLHHQELCGQPPGFSASIREVLTIGEKREKTLAWLRARLADPTLAAAARGARAGQLARLDDSEGAAARQEAAVRRARNTLRTATEALRRQSARALLDSASAAMLSELTGVPVAVGDLPPHALDVLLLFRSRAPSPLVTELLRALLRGEGLEMRAVNPAWLAAAAIDANVWLGGVEETFHSSAHGEVTIGVELRPILALRMGTHFDTCLSLDGGFNAHSALLNVLDVNKHVVFARDQQGRVLGRKLIGATRRGELAGYRPYVRPGCADLVAALTDACERFATAAGLRLSDRARPEALHDPNWYDDGNWRWKQRPLLDRPQAELEAYRRSLSADAAELRVLALHSDHDWRLPLERLAGLAPSSLRGLYFVGDVASLRVAVGDLRWFRSGWWDSTDPWHTDQAWRALLGPGPPTRAHLVAVAQAILASNPRRHRGTRLLDLPVEFGVLDFGDLTDLLLFVEGLAPSEAADLPWEQRASLLMRLAWAAAPNPRALIRGLDPTRPKVARAVLQLLARAPQQSLADRLRALVRTGELLPDSARALARLGQPRDAALLQSLSVEWVGDRQDGREPLWSEEELCGSEADIARWVQSFGASIQEQEALLAACSEHSWFPWLAHLPDHPLLLERLLAAHARKEAVGIRLLHLAGTPLGEAAMGLVRRAVDQEASLLPALVSAAMRVPRVDLNTVSGWIEEGLARGAFDPRWLADEDGIWPAQHAVLLAWSGRHTPTERAAMAESLEALGERGRWGALALQDH